MLLLLAALTAVVATADGADSPANSPANRSLVCPARTP
jgi:hypothetical protein